MRNSVISFAVFAVATLTASMAPAQSSSATIAGRAEIIDGDTIDVAGARIRLYGIDAPEKGQRCNGVGGGTWPCGEAAIAKLAELAEGKQVSCISHGLDDYDRVLAVCTAGTIELNAEMVRQGLAWAFVRYSKDYVGIEASARSKEVGIWPAPSEPPWDYRAKRWEVAAQVAPNGCPIKGNISRNGERIYHPPWSPWYDRTKVSTDKGERWFCSEREALDAGWRAPKWK